MCEIAVTQNLVRSDNTEALVELCRVLYAQNNDGLGIVAIHRDEAQESFQYRYYKSTEPDFDGGGVRSVFESNPDAWRFAIHARLATAGGTGVDQTHPLMTHQCDECSHQMVMHNGIVRGDKRRRSDLIGEGHEFDTEVDSEVIAHTVGELPDTLGEDSEFEQPSLYGSLNYLIFAEDGILIRNNGKYELTDDFKIVCGVRDSWKSDSWTGSDDDGYSLVKPDGSIEFEEYEGRYTGSSNVTVVGRGGFGGRRGAYGTSSRDSDDEDDSKSSFRSRRRGIRRTRVTRSASSLPERFIDLTDEEQRIATFYHQQSKQNTIDAFDDHAGWYEAADYVYCFEHNRLGVHICSDCSDDEDFDVMDVPIIKNLMLPVLLESAESSSGHTSVVAGTICDEHDCVHIGRSCPVCNEDDEPEARGYGGRPKAAAAAQSHKLDDFPEEGEEGYEDWETIWGDDPDADSFGEHDDDGGADATEACAVPVSDAEQDD